MSKLAIMIRLAPLAAICISVATTAFAEDDVARAELLSGWRGKDGVHIAGLKIDLAPGWKTYWRAPGEAGIPPIFDWSGSDNIESVTPLWPTPQVFDLNEMQTIGYKDGVVLPLEITLKDASKDAHAKGYIEMGVCEEICMPVSFSFEAVLPSKGKRSAPIVAALVDRPLGAEEAGVRNVGCKVTPSEGGLNLETAVQMTALGVNETVVIETSAPDDWVTETVSRREGSLLLASAEILAMGTAPVSFDRSSTIITVISEGRSVEIHGCQAE